MHLGVPDKLPTTRVVGAPSPVHSQFVILHCMLPGCRVAEVVRGHGGPPPKSLDSDENFKAEHTFFCHKLRFFAIYAHFKDL